MRPLFLNYYYGSYGKVIQWWCAKSTQQDKLPKAGALTVSEQVYSHSEADDRCFTCGKAHSLVSCEWFLNSSVAKRRQAIYNYGACYKCFKQGWGQLLFSITNTITITVLHIFPITIINTITIIYIFQLQIQLQLYFSITNTITITGVYFHVLLNEGLIKKPKNNEIANSLCILTTTLSTPLYGVGYMHKIVELNELNIFCEFFPISSQKNYCVMLVSLWNNNSYGTSPSTYNICITIIQCWRNVKDVGQTLYKCYTNVVCLVGL